MLSMLAVFAVSAVASSSASAAGCYQVAEAGKGFFEKINATTEVCEGGPVAGREFAEVERLETEFSAGVWCAKVKTAGQGNFEDNECKKAKAASEYVKVKLPAHGFWVCKEKAGAGTEPPIKYDNHECNTKAKPLAERKWEWRPLERGETFEVKSESGPTTLEGKILGTRVIIECKKDKDTGIIGAGGKSTDTVITYEECSLAQVVKHVKEPLACTVGTAGVIKTNALKDLLITGKGIGPEDEFEPETGTTFAEISVTGCALESTNKVTGKQICSLPAATVGKLEQEVACLPSGGELKYGGEPASYYGTEKVKLVNGWWWDAE
jgi:hypothetical protein